MNLRLLHRLAAFFRRDKLDHELREEISAHQQLAIEENLRRGMSAEEARRQALVQFGGTQQALEAAREHRSLPLLSTIIRPPTASPKVTAGARQYPRPSSSSLRRFGNERTPHYKLL